MANYGFSREECEAEVIGKALAKALDRVEQFTGDSDLALCDALLWAKTTGAKQALQALQALLRFYCGEEDHADGQTV